MSTTMHFVRVCSIFWQVKSDVMIEGKDLFRTGVVLGVNYL